MTPPQEPFSRRLGLRRQHEGPPIYHSAPEGLRFATLSMICGELEKSPSWIRDIICAICRVRPDPENWSLYPNVWDEAQRLVYEAAWYEFYDFVESCAAITKHEGQLAEFERHMNRLFEEEHIGWRLNDGILEIHGEETLEAATGTTEEELANSGFHVAAQELREARADLSRRPEPDLSGALHHAMAALESVAREVGNDPKQTLGEIIKKQPGLFPPPVDDAAAKLWGFASEQARHCKESRKLEWAETLLVVGLAGTLCSYLNAKGSET